MDVQFIQQALYLRHCPAGLQSGGGLQAISTYNRSIRTLNLAVIQHSVKRRLSLGWPEGEPQQTECEPM